MCLSTPSAPAAAAAPTPVAPVAPLEPPKPMALAEAANSNAASRRGGISQLRIQSQSANTAVPLGNGMAGQAASTIAGRKAQLDAQIAASGG